MKLKRGGTLPNTIKTELALIALSHIYSIRIVVYALSEDHGSHPQTKETIVTQERVTFQEPNQTRKCTIELLFMNGHYETLMPNTYEHPNLIYER
jgi:hypothetical protein